MRIISYLKNSLGAVAIIVVLLIVQAATDLSLPHFTSNIVDVGIQQSGIEHAAMDAMGADTFETVCALSSDEDESTLRGAYSLGNDGLYHLEADARKDLDQLDGIVELPLVAIHYADQAGFDLDGLRAAYDEDLVAKEQIQGQLDRFRSQMGEGTEALLSQQAIEAAKAEYQAIGYDTTAMQMGYLLRVGALMLGLTALGMLAAVGVGFVASRTAAGVGRTLRQRLFERVVSFSDREVQSFSAASLITRGTNDIQQIQMVTVMLLRMVLYAPILAIGGILMVSTTNASMSWIIVLAVACLFAVVGVLMFFAMPKFRIMQKLVDRVNLVAREMLTGLPVIRAFDRQEYEQERFDDASRMLYRTQLFTNRVMTFMMPSMMLIMNGVSVLIIWVGGAYIDDGTIQTGDMIAFISYSMTIIASFLIIGMISIMLPRADVAAQRVNEVLKTEPSVKDPAHPRDAELPENGGARVEFDDVAFGYADEDGDGAPEPVLQHVSFTVEPGTVCAVVGSTGSGKSTVVKLIERFYDATAGSVKIDGIDVRELSQEKLRGTVAYVPQKAFLFSGTIDSNIAYSDAGMPDERVEEAARIAQSSDFIEAKPEGFESPVSQGGTNVSGGQRQRLCIARAIASDARVLVFDDSFSALDYKTDSNLRLALRRSLGDRTLVIVAQRISTVMDADQIIVLEEGRMVGKGTHAQLMESCEEYREIAYSQLSEEELKGGDAA